MTWNHRIVRTDHPDWLWEQELGAEAVASLGGPTAPRYRYGVHEAYYGDNGEVSWTVLPTELWAEGLDTLREHLAAALAACELAILVDDASDALPVTTCAYCGARVYGSPNGWHDERGREVCPSGASPTSFHEEVTRDA